MGNEIAIILIKKKIFQLKDKTFKYKKSGNYDKANVLESEILGMLRALAILENISNQNLFNH